VATNFSTVTAINTELQRYIEQLARVRADYRQEVQGWHQVGGSNGLGKGLPYNSFETFRQIQRTGCRLYRDCDTIQSVVSKMVSYVVSSGHTYGVSARKVPGTISRVRVSKRLVDEIKAIIDITMDTAYPGGWQAMQEESVVRLYREGEFFRRIFTGDDSLDVRFIEPEYIRPRPKDPDGNVHLGILTADGDAVTVKGYQYWKPTRDNYSLDDENFIVLDASEVQHAKQGVDANDPRGIPILWVTDCRAKRMDEVDEAMCELAVTQASYAVIRQYDNSVTIEHMREIARGFQAEKERNEGRPVPGTEVEAKGFEFQFPSMESDPGKFVEIIRQQQRQIGGLLDMPEFLVSSDARTGNRASLVSAEGPFDRRVQRDQRKLANHDIELLWRSVQAHKGWDEAALKEYRKVVKIEPRFPLAASRDHNKEADTLVKLVDKRLKSHQQAIAQLGGDYEITQSQIEEHQAAYPPVDMDPGQEPKGEDRVDPKPRSSNRDK